MGDFTQDNRIGKLATVLGKDALLLLSLTATDRLSESYTITVDVVSETVRPVHTLLGTAASVAFAADDPNVARAFAGIVWEYSELGGDERGHHYRLVLRPPMEFLTLNRRNRVFQNKSAVDIAKTLIAGDYKADLTGSYPPHEYCVQYQESDFAFFSRLLEWEGIYYFYEQTDGATKLVLVDSSNAHPDLTPASALVLPQSARRPDAPIWSVVERRGLGPTKVSVADYDFEAPRKALLQSKAAAKPAGDPTERGETSEPASGGTWADKAELFDYPAKYDSKQIPTGDRHSATWLDAQRRRMARSFAEGALFSAAVGRRLKLSYANGTSSDYLIVATAHEYTGPPHDSSAGESEFFHCSLELIPWGEQYRPALATPRPRVLGPQTAVVVGPAGDEIYTDKYGRIKVQFYWDREGGKDDKSSCFVRVMQSVAGQSWGSFALPRIGQEVVVEFLDGDPDRPLVTGAVYNAENMPPETLPDNKTQHGIKTRSTKGGGGFNRLWFEDKKGSEVVWFKAERDYNAWVLNGHETRLYSTGNRTTTFAKGNDEKVIDKGNLTTTIKLGNETRTLDTGDRATTLKKGNESLKVSMGNIDVKADLGKIAIEAMQSIELKVGGSSITIDQVGIKIKGTVSVDIKGVMVQSTADAIHTVKGGLVMIN